MQRCTLRKDGVRRGRGCVDIQSHMDTRWSGERGGEKQGKTEESGAKKEREGIAARGWKRDTRFVRHQLADR